MSDHEAKPSTPAVEETPKCFCCGLWPTHWDCMYEGDVQAWQEKSPLELHNSLAAATDRAEAAERLVGSQMARADEAHSKVNEYRKLYGQEYEKREKAEVALAAAERAQMQAQMERNHADDLRIAAKLRADEAEAALKPLRDQLTFYKTTEKGKLRAALAAAEDDADALALIAHKRSLGLHNALDSGRWEICKQRACTADRKAIAAHQQRKAGEGV